MMNLKLDSDYQSKMQKYTGKQQNQSFENSEQMPPKLISYDNFNNKEDLKHFNDLLIGQKDNKQLFNKDEDQIENHVKNLQTAFKEQQNKQSTNKIKYNQFQINTDYKTQKLQELNKQVKDEQKNTSFIGKYLQKNYQKKQLDNIRKQQNEELDENLNVDRMSQKHLSNEHQQLKEQIYQLINAIRQPQDNYTKKQLKKQLQMFQERQNIFNELQIELKYQQRLKQNENELESQFKKEKEQIEQQINGQNIEILRLEQGIQNIHQNRLGEIYQQVEKVSQEIGLQEELNHQLNFKNKAKEEEYKKVLEYQKKFQKNYYETQKQILELEKNMDSYDLDFDGLEDKLNDIQEMMKQQKKEEKRNRIIE